MLGRVWTSVIGICAALAPIASGIAQAGRPQLEKRGRATQLIVDGKPFLVLGGELHNSSSSSVECMKPVWLRLTEVHLYAFGQISAIGFSPFGIDDQGNAPLDLVGITNPAVPPDNFAIRNVYDELSKLLPDILEAQRTGNISAAVIEGDAQRAARLRLGDYMANVSRAGSASGAGSRLAAMFLQKSPNQFIVTGRGDVSITFSTDNPGLPIVGIDRIDEEYFDNGAWVPRRRLNGDEDAQGQSLRLYPTDLARGRIYLVRLYRYR